MHYETYCNEWKLCINTEKTKVVIFGKNCRRPIFLINGSEIDIVNNFTYLGVSFTKSGRFRNTINKNISKARRAAFSLLRNCRQNCLPIDCQLELFQKCIEPILLYGCEVWGFENVSSIEKFRLKMYKTILKARQSTPSYMIYGELGLTPLLCSIQSRMISFWGRLITANQNRMSHTLYGIMLNETEKRGTTFKWLETIRNILNSTGFHYVWLQQKHIERLNCGAIKQTLSDQSVQTLRAEYRNNNRGRHYDALKKSWCLETYFNKLDTIHAINIFKFRTCNHKFPVETGRHRNIEHKNRTCTFCHQDVGDEYHYIMSCQAFTAERNKYLPLYYHKKPSMAKYCELLSTLEKPILLKLAKFVGILLKNVT